MKKLKTRAINTYGNGYYAQYERFGIWFNFYYAYIPSLASIGKNESEFDRLTPREVTTLLYFTYLSPKYSIDFNETVDFCKRFETYNDVKKYHKEQKDILKKYKQKLNDRILYWEST